MTRVRDRRRAPSLILVLGVVARLPVAARGVEQQPRSACRDRRVPRSRRRPRAAPARRSLDGAAAAAPLRSIATSHDHRRRDLSAVRHPRHRRRRPHGRSRARRSAARTRRYLARARRRRRGRRRPRQPAERRRAARRAGRRADERRRRRRRHRRRADAAALLGLHHLDVVGGIQITGSHNPPEYNGFKICVGHRLAARRRDPGALRARSRAATFADGDGHGARARRSSTATSTTSSQRIGPLARPLKVVVDCGNGAGALVAPQLFDAARRRRRTCLFCESDGTFPEPPSRTRRSREPRGPHRRGEAASSAELGIAFDGDADRIGVVDDDGRRSSGATTS